MITLILFRKENQEHKKKTLNGPIVGLCLPPDVFYVYEFLFDEMVKIKFSQITCHEEILLLLALLTNRSRQVYSVSLAFLRKRSILRNK